MAQTMNLSQVEEAKKILEPTLLAHASLVDSSELAKLGINVLTGIENKDIVFRYKGNEANARQYNANKRINAKTGSFDQIELQVKPVWTRTTDNLQMYREKEPLSIIGVSENDPAMLNCPVTQLRLTEMAKQFANQNILNFIHGDEDNADVSGKGAYSCYDGLNAKFAALKSASTPKMSAGLGNYYKLGVANADIAASAIAAKTGTTLDAFYVNCYDEFEKYLLNWDEDLQDADSVNIMMSRQWYQCIVNGAALKYKSAVQSQIIVENGITSLYNRQNIHLMPTKLIGKGVQMISYVPGILDFGTDLTRIGDPASAFIDITKNPEDSNEFFAQMQVALGTRVNMYESHSLCVAADKNDKFNEPKALREEVTVTDSIEARLAALEAAAAGA